MQHATGWIRRFRLLTLPELWLLAEAQVTLVYCQLLRWLRPVGRLLNVTPSRDMRPAVRTQLREAAQMGWAVTRAARYGVFRPRCLVRSMALQRMLERRAIPGTELRIGVRWQNGEFTAHAWVEINGRVVGDSAQAVSRFTPTTNLRLVQL